MTDEKFDVVFRGELQPGADLARVKQNLSRLFKMDEARIEALFSGKAVVLKRAVDGDTVDKYRMAIGKAGACVETPLSQPSAAVATETAAAQPTEAAQPQRLHPAPAAPQTASERPGDTATAEADALSLAPAVGDILAPHEKQVQPDVEIDTTSFSLRPADTALLDDDEYEQQVPLPLDLEGLDLAEVGADVLRPEERQAETAAEIDLSGLSVAPQGDRLEAPKEPPPPAPDVSQISLVDQS